MSARDAPEDKHLVRQPLDCLRRPLMCEGMCRQIGLRLLAETETGLKRQQETEVISRWAPISHIHTAQLQNDNDNEAIS